MRCLVDKKEGINIAFLICLPYHNTIATLKICFRQPENNFCSDDRQAWSVSNKRLQSAKSAFVLHLPQAASSICILFPSFRLCLATSQGAEGWTLWETAEMLSQYL